MAREFPLSIVVRAIDRATAPMRRINARMQALTEGPRRINNQIRLMAREAGLPRIAKAVDGIAGAAGRTVDAAGASLRRFLGIVAPATAGIALLASTTAAYGDDVAKTAFRLGLTTDQLQEYRFAAERSGIATSTFDMAIQQFGRRAADARRGTGEAVEAFEALQIQMLDTAGNIRPVNDLFRDVADRMAAIEDPTTRNLVATKLFGEEGLKLVQMLGDGTAGLDRLAAEAHRLGLVMRKEATTEAAHFTDRVTNLTTVLGGLQRRIGSALLPVLGTLAERLTAAIGENPERIAAIADRIAASIPTWDQFVGAFERIRAVSLGAWQTLQPIVDLLGGPMNAALIAVGAFIAGPLLVALGGLAAAFGTLGAALLATPFGWLIIMVGAIAALALVVWRNWDGIADFFEGVWDGIAGAFRDGVDRARTALQPLFAAAGDIAAAGAALFDRFHAAAAGAADRLMAFLGMLAGRIRAALAPVLEPIHAGLDLAGRLGSRIAGFFGLGPAAEGDDEAAGADARGPARARPLGARAAIARAAEPRAGRGGDGADGEVTVRFENPPPGLRPEVTRGRGIAIEADRGLAFGAP
ncbi:phage tail tape measure protein [Oceanibacterium hippocampi]|uniref:Phage-related minor tail protein n=1 Tax=Oceanibacterium hippocampi TaxID=745714 RepID=A0A1Y5U0X6_9PROT|nr:phage tail tape measure protein [Oceanibacterium hippocampi]SLN77607.1 hypothetical protein OCH7691_04479 [Oceanibacterium hippocampi]